MCSIKPHYAFLSLRLLITINSGNDGVEMNYIKSARERINYPFSFQTITENIVNDASMTWDLPTSNWLYQVTLNVWIVSTLSYNFETSFPLILLKDNNIAFFLFQTHHCRRILIHSNLVCRNLDTCTFVICQ